MGGERLDTRNPISKLMLTIFAGVASRERQIMLERQREGIAKAKAAGRDCPSCCRESMELRTRDIYGSRCSAPLPRLLSAAGAAALPGLRRLLPCPPDPVQMISSTASASVGAGCGRRRRRIETDTDGVALDGPSHQARRCLDDRKCS